MLELDGLCARAGDFALGPVTLRVAPQEHRLIIGPSGAGKSLLLRVIAGFQRAASGVCMVGGHAVIQAPAARRRCAWVGQRAALFAHLSVRENIAFGLRVQRISPERIVQRVDTLADRLGLCDLLQRAPHQLSIGQQQRVALARALAPGFGLLLLDEPFSALDRGARIAMSTLLDDLCAEYALAIVHVTHDIDVLRATPLRAFALAQGRVVQDGTLAEMFANPATMTLRQALGA